MGETHTDGTRAPGLVAYSRKKQVIGQNGHGRNRCEGEYRHGSKRHFIIHVCMAELWRKKGKGSGKIAAMFRPAGG